MAIWCVFAALNTGLWKPSVSPTLLAGGWNIWTVSLTACSTTCTTVPEWCDADFEPVLAPATTGTAASAINAMTPTAASVFLRVIMPPYVDDPNGDRPYAAVRKESTGVSPRS